MTVQPRWQQIFIVALGHMPNKYSHMSYIDLCLMDLSASELHVNSILKLMIVLDVDPPILVFLMTKDKMGYDWKSQSA